MPTNLAWIGPTPVDRTGLVERLRLTGIAAAQALLLAPALALGILGIIIWPLTLVLVGIPLALVVVPLTQLLTNVSRRVAANLLGEPVDADYAATTGKGVVGRLTTWVRDPARWRDFAHLWFSATGGFVLCALPALALAAPVVYVVGAIVDFSGWWLFLLFLSGPILTAWWFITPPLARARALADRSLLGHRRVEELERRVSEVAESRSEALDHSAAEVRRIERDLHDGAQARIAAIGMNVGLAEKLIDTDPATASELLREVRETTLSALADLRTVVRGIHPPVLADRGLAGGIEALVIQLPIPVTLALDLEDRLPAPVESAAYFAVAECVANTLKHAEATRAWVTATHDGSLLRVQVGDDGVGGADPAGAGVAGVAKRLAAFDGKMVLTSPPGGPTVVTLEVPCPTLPTPPDR
ncbi:sensor histidine kinase [Nocardioides alcanivorans]|uniref:sensor histidine kinase n=1 Tax=Nocardioides alcanivorans TaxID=2897352 RepID=UPI001F38C647|nr:histidine kinase [Nocardioides alcanivorans]